jgi:hypothetical protein
VKIIVIYGLELARSLPWELIIIPVTSAVDRFQMLYLTHIVPIVEVTSVISVWTSIV